MLLEEQGQTQMADGDGDSDCVLFAALLGTAVVVPSVIGLRLA